LFCIVKRFFPPVPKHSWSGEKDVRTLANTCVQIQGEAFGSGEWGSVIGWKQSSLS
jgi:carboxylesterase type B